MHPATSDTPLAVFDSLVAQLQSTRRRHPTPASIGRRRVATATKGSRRRRPEEVEFGGGVGEEERREVGEEIDVGVEEIDVGDRRGDRKEIESPGTTEREGGNEDVGGNAESQPTPKEKRRRAPPM